MPIWMRRRALKVAASILIILSLLAPAGVYASGDVVYTNTRSLADNLELVNTVYWSSEFGRMEGFSVRMTGPGDAYPIVMKGDTIYGSTRITNIVKYAESLGMNVLAAVNTDFFFSESGIPLGIVVEDGVYKSSPGGRNAVTFGYDGGVDIIEAPNVLITLYNNGGGEGGGAGGVSGAGDQSAADGQAALESSGNAGKTVAMRNFNKTRTDTGGMVLYSEVFSTVSTRTSSPGWFVRFRILEGSPSVSGTMTLEVEETFTAEGAIAIGEGCLVLTAADQSGAGAEFEKFTVGDIVTLTTTCSDARLEYAQYATGGGDIIVSNGEAADPAGWSPSLAPRAPRTAFGLRGDGTIISYIVDGRNSEHSVGMTLSELADEMARQGCVYAVNFDGGGSTALSARLPGSDAPVVVSRPSDGTERGCATYILFVTDAAPDGTPRRLSLGNDGIVVLAESSVGLTFAATDRGFMPAAVPDDIIASVSEPGASINDATYTAGSIAGADRVTLYSPSTGARGWGEIYVITRPTSITAARAGQTSPLTSVSLSPGDTLELSVTSTYYRRAVVSQSNSYTFDVTGDIGEMIAPGIFVAGNSLLETGEIAISAGGRSIAIQVEICGFTDMVGHWGREYAEYLLQAGISNGVSETQYGPSLLMKRADYILMLYRAAGEPDFEGEGNFDDVPADAYYARALAWAMASGIAFSANSDDTEGGSGGETGEETGPGPGENTFDPQEPVTRQDAFTFTYRALPVLGIERDDGTFDDLAAFPDADTLSDYAAIPTATLIRAGVVDGMGGMLAPRETLTRAQMAKVLAVVLRLEGTRRNDA